MVIHSLSLYNQKQHKIIIVMSDVVWCGSVYDKNTTQPSPFSMTWSLNNLEKEQEIEGKREKKDDLIEIIHRCWYCAKGIA